MEKCVGKNNKQFVKLNCSSKASKQPSIDVVIQHYKENLNRYIIENKQNRMYSNMQRLKNNSSENKQLDRSVIQYKLQNNAVDATAQDILEAAGAIPDYSGWSELEDFKLFENVSPVINFTSIASSNIGVTIDGALAQGSSFKSMKEAITALKKQVFVSFDNDKQMGLYNWIAISCPDIRYEFVEKAFRETFSSTVEESINDTISIIDLNGSTRSNYSRHDFQDSRREVVNLQIQLGGSLPFGTSKSLKGKTSETLVVIDTSVWNLLKGENPNRLKCMIQEAHRKSFHEKVKIEIRPFVQPPKSSKKK